MILTLNEGKFIYFYLNQIISNVILDKKIDRLTRLLIKIDGQYIQKKEHYFTILVNPSISSQIIRFSLLIH